MSQDIFHTLGPVVTSHHGIEPHVHGSHLVVSNILGGNSQVPVRPGPLPSLPLPRPPLLLSLLPHRKLVVDRQDREADQSVHRRESIATEVPVELWH